MEMIKKTNCENALALLYHDTGRITAENVFSLAKTGDKVAQEILNEVSFHLGLALANVANTLNPHKIIIGGGVSKAGDLLLKPLKEYIQKFSFPQVAFSTEIVLAKLGNNAGVIGAAWMIKNSPI